MNTTSPEALADELVRKFQHMVQRDGGELSVAAVDDETIRLRYRPGVDPTCEGGECVLPGAELQTLLNETLGRRRTGLRLDLEVV